MEDWYYLEGKSLEQKCQGFEKYDTCPEGMENGPFFTKSQLKAMKDPASIRKKSSTRANSSNAESHSGVFEFKHLHTSQSRSNDNSVLAGTAQKGQMLSRFSSPELNLADWAGEMQLERTKAINLENIQSKKDLDPY